MTPKRILITTPNLDTAGLKYILGDVIRNIDAEQFCPSLCVHKKTDTALEHELAAAVDTFLELPLRSPHRVGRNLWQDLRRSAAKIRNRFDVIHSFDYASSWHEGAIAKLCGIPWIATKTNMNSGSKYWMRNLLATKIVCLSHKQYELLYSESVFAQKVQVVHVGINLELFRADRDEKTAIHNELRIPQNDLIIGCVAHLVPVKGHPELLKAFAQISVRYPNVHLVLVGGGESAYQIELENQTKELQLENRVHFLGIRSDVYRLMPSFDGFILATRNTDRAEAFGTVLVEAMASGVPVIATKAGGPEDIVVDGVTGWLVPSGGSEPFVTAMDELISSPELRVRYGRAALRRAHDMFSRELMVQRYQELYSSIAR